MENYYMYPWKFPKAGDLVMVQVVEVNDIYSSVKLLEYNNVQGMIVHAQLSRKKIHSLSKYIREGQKMALEVYKIDEEKNHIDLTNRNIVDKDEYLEKYKKANKLHLISLHIAKNIGWDYHKFLEEIIHPLYDPLCGNDSDIDTAYDKLKVDIENNNIEWLKNKLGNGFEFCYQKFVKLYKPQKIKFDPLIVELTSYEQDGLNRIKYVGLDTESELLKLGINISIKRVGKKYHFNINNKNMTTEKYSQFIQNMRDILYDKCEKYSVIINEHQ